MELERILDELENMIMDATRVPLTNKCIVETEQLGQIMDAIRTSIPLEIKQARQLLIDRERRINEAMEEKQRIIQQAEVVAEKMITEEEVYREAKERSADMLSQANNEAYTIRMDAEEYAQKLRSEALDFANKMHEDTMIYVREIFDYLEATLGKTTDALQQSREVLSKKAKGEA